LPPASTLRPFGAYHSGANRFLDLCLALIYVRHRRTDFR
jgi:hypothetical protein